MTKHYRAVRVKKGVVRDVWTVQSAGDWRVFVGSPADCQKVADLLNDAFEKGRKVGHHEADVECAKLVEGLGRKIDAAMVRR